MSQFELYLRLGLQHIGDITGYDHILFIIALCVLYRPNEWKKVIGLVTAFTIGHSITLALSTTNILTIPSEIIEFLIPVTIFITALSNIVYFKKNIPSQLGRQYGFAILFGLIHGMGFSNYLKKLLGETTSIIEPLLAFNIGLEIGQLLIVGSFMLLSFTATNVIKTPFHYWIRFISIIIALLSLYLMWETKFW